MWGFGFRNRETPLIKGPIGLAGAAAVKAFSFNMINFNEGLGQITAIANYINLLLLSESDLKQHYAELNHKMEKLKLDLKALPSDSDARK